MIDRFLTGFSAFMFSFAMGFWLLSWEPQEKIMNGLEAYQLGTILIFASPFTAIYYTVKNPDIENT